MTKPQTRNALAASTLALLGTLAAARTARADDPPGAAPAAPAPPPLAPPPGVQPQYPNAYPPGSYTVPRVVYAPPPPAVAGDDDVEIPPVARPPRPRRHLGPPLPAPFGVSVGYRSYWHTDGAYRAFATSDLTSGPAVYAGYELATVADRVQVELGVGYAHESSAGVFAQSADGSLASDYVSAELTGRLVLLDWFLPHVRLAGGGVYHRFALDTRDGLAPMAGSAWAGFASAGAGVTLRTPSRMLGDGALRTVRIALTLEGGYLYAGEAPLDLAAQPPAGGGTATPIATRPLHLGALSASGAYFHVGVGLRF